MEEKIEYIKRNKFPFLLILLILLISITLFIGINVNKGKQDKALYLEEQKQLSEMSGYLNEVDEIVTSNTDKLESISLFETSIDDKLGTLYEDILVLDESISTIEANTIKYREETHTESTKVISSLTTLSISQQEIKEQITEVSNLIVTCLDEIKAEDEKNFTNTFGKLDKLESSLDKLHQDTAAYFRDITKLITTLQSENQAEHTELLETLANTSNNISELIETEAYSLQLKMDENLSILLDKHNALHNQIADAKTSITNLLHMMDENADNRQQEIKESFASVAATLKNIQNDYAEAHAEIRDLITTLQETEIANHSETLSTLTVLETNMTETASQNLSYLTDSLLVLEEKFDTSINSMNEEMSQSFNTLNTDFINHLTQQGNNITDQFSQLTNHMVNQYTNISNAISSNGSDQQIYLDDLQNFLTGKLNQVFTFVSDGKRKCASALLTKGIAIKEDATFQEIYQAILNVPQNLLIGVEKVPGNISYDFHYHINHAGANTHSNTDTVSGGCYTQPNYHSHSTGQGCYKKVDFHTHNDSCPGHSYWVDWNPASPDGYWAWGYDCNDKPNNSSRQDLVCSKSGSTVDYYSANCGLNDGQIIGAHIVYNQSSVARVLTEHMQLSTELQDEDAKMPDEATEMQDEVIELPNEMIEIPEETVSGNTIPENPIQEQE